MTERFTERLVRRLDHVDRRKVGEYLIGLAREKGLLENIFNSMQEGLLVINPTGMIVLINEPAARLLGIPVDSVGLPYEDSIRDPGLRSIISQGFEVPGQALIREFIIIRPAPRWVRLSRTSLRDSEDHFRGIMMVLADITRQRKAEEEISLVERLDFLSHLTAGVAHEIGNPIGSLAIQVQLVERQVRELDSPLRDKLLRTVSLINEELRRLDLIVDQFLKTLRPDELHLRKNNLVAVTEDILALVEEDLREKDITLEKIFPPQGIWGRMDENLIKQAILNLVINAGQAMPRGGKITVRMEEENTYLKFSITDQGTGIPREKISRLFEPLFTTKETGSGLGLLVVYKAIRQHGGYVEVTSQPGKGTTFTIWLPQRPDRIKLLPAGE